MAREKEGYRDLLERFRQVADRMWPGRVILTREQAAQLVGVTPRTLINHGFGPHISCEELARYYS